MCQCLKGWHTPYIPPPSNYFVTLSKIKESMNFSLCPPAFSDDVILYDFFFWPCPLPNETMKTYNVFPGSYFLIITRVNGWIVSSIILPLCNQWTHCFIMAIIDIECLTLFSHFYSLDIGFGYHHKVEISMYLQFLILFGFTTVVWNKI